MRRQYSLYPKNKTIISNFLFQLPLKNNSFSYERYNTENPNEKSVLPKSHKITKLIKEITNSNPVQLPNEQTNLYNYQKLLLEEKIKNKNYSDIIVSLKKQIEEMEGKFELNGQNINNEIMRLRNENQELKIFKEKVYQISIKYDELNKNILTCLKSIEKFIQKYNTNNDIKIENNLSNISQNFKSITNDLSNFMMVKQEEYNTLLNEKENEIEKLKKELSCGNINLYTNDSKLYKDKEMNSNRSYEYLNCNRENKKCGRNKLNTFCKNYKYNEFDYGNSKRNYELKSNYEDF
jgi:hypothetical protein